MSTVPFVNLDRIIDIISVIPSIHVISTTCDSCILVGPHARAASEAYDLLLQHSIISKVIRGHFMDCYYITVRYAN